jgi:vacuolar-type H+-ATPase subunit I/STV1
MAEKLKAAAGSFERLMLPRLNSIDGELKAMNAKIDSVEESLGARIDGFEKSLGTRIDSVEESLGARIDGFEKSVDSFRNEMRAELKVVNVKVDQIDQKLDIDKRMLIMEAELKELKKKA